MSYAEIYSETQVRKTRKPCRCYWCGEAILKGDPSTVVAGKWEGDFWSGRFHPECVTARNEWFSKYRDDEAPERGTMQRGSIEVKPEHIQ
jgi:hypothetical protein